MCEPVRQDWGRKSVGRTERKISQAWLVADRWASIFCKQVDLGLVATGKQEKCHAVHSNCATFVMRWSVPACMGLC